MRGVHSLELSVKKTFLTDRWVTDTQQGCSGVISAQQPLQDFVPADLRVTWRQLMAQPGSVAGVSEHHH